jgi:predicted DNA-binding transcriptional regulator YafY
MKEMYDIEMVEARKLIDETKRDAAAAIAKTQQVELELKSQKSRFVAVSGARETDRKEIDAIERRIAENEAVRFNLTASVE